MIERPLSGKADIHDTKQVSAHIGNFLRLKSPHKQAMLTELYIGALLVDEELADQIWEAWDAGEIDDATAWLTWWLIFSFMSIEGIRA